jgi:hypothetical protein
LSTNMEITNTRRWGPGWRSGPDTRFTTGRLTRPGSTRSNAGLPSSRNAPFAGVHSAASKNWWRKSIPSSSITIARTGPSSGPQPPTPSSAKSPDFVHIFPGHNTSLVLSQFYVQNLPS